MIRVKFRVRVRVRGRRGLDKDRRTDFICMSNSRVNIIYMIYVEGS